LKMERVHLKVDATVVYGNETAPRSETSAPAK